MTKEAKKERQQAKHELQAACRERIPLGVRLSSTIAQQKAMAKSLAAQYVSAAVSSGIGR